MNSAMEASVEDEVGQTRMKRPHVIILGAGASRAACPNGDKNGRLLPLMKDFVEGLDLESLLSKWGIDPNQNFEDIYSDLYQSGEQAKTEELNKIINLYFGAMELPDNPNLYDHLVLSMRSKDLIATFNWDPFLVEAICRNRASGLKLPRIVFLHGNVAVSYCPKCGIKGRCFADCDKCAERLIKTPLLYPVKEKNYADDTFISNEWRILKRDMGSAFMITIFGYSGPKTDAEAITAMKAGWGDPNERSMEQTAFISTQREEDIAENWDAFIHSHHYEVQNDFYESWIANHPRRTGEAYMHQYIDAKFIDNNPIPKDLNFPELWAWYAQFKEPEERNPD